MGDDWLDRLLDRSFGDTLTGLGRGRGAPEEVGPLSDDVLAAVLAHRAEILEQLASAAGRETAAQTMVRRTRRFLDVRAQYARLEPLEVEALTELYRQLVASLHPVVRKGGAGLGPALDELATAHLRNLLALLAAARDHEELVRAATGEATTLCAGYRPALQLAVLGVDPRELMEPILDVGAGPEGALVRELAARGLDVRGIDRLAEPGPGLEPGDWLDYPMEPGRWGTILSHMAFSNHFLRHHRQGDAEALRYAARYMEFLGALCPGGRFIYAPSLPFVEELLDAATFRVRHHRVPELAETDPALALSSSVTRLEPPHTTRAAHAQADH